MVGFIFKGQNMKKIEEYEKFIPHFCSFDHEKESCSLILYGYTENRIGCCRTCSFSVMAERKVKFLNALPLLSRKIEWRW